MPYYCLMQVQQMASTAPLTGGYDCEFVETPPDKLMCQICLSVAHTPHQMPCCGRVYCKACLDTHKRLSNTCPNCRSTRQSFPDTRGESKSDSSYLNTVRSNSMVLKINTPQRHMSLVLCPLMVALYTLYTCMLLLPAENMQVCGLLTLFVYEQMYITGTE